MKALKNKENEGLNCVFKNSFNHFVNYYTITNCYLVIILSDENISSLMQLSIVC